MAEARIIVDLQARADVAQVRQMILSHEQVCEVRWSNVIQRLQEMKGEQTGASIKLDDLRRAGTKQLYTLLAGSVGIIGMLLWQFVIVKGS